MADIRSAVAEDLIQVEDCAVAAYSVYVERIGRKPAPMVADFRRHLARGELFVARDEVGAVKGYIVLYPRDDHLHVENVAVGPANQGQGIGVALMSFAEEQARRHGCAALELYTNAKMTENLSLYPKLGYEETDRRTEDGFDRVYFRKTLAAKS